MPFRPHLVFNEYYELAQSTYMYKGKLLTQSLEELGRFTVSSEVYGNYQVVVTKDIVRNELVIGIEGTSEARNWVLNTTVLVHKTINDVISATPLEYIYMPAFKQHIFCQKLMSGIDRYVAGTGLKVGGFVGHSAGASLADSLIKLNYTDAYGVLFNGLQIQNTERVVNLRAYDDPVSSYFSNSDNYLTVIEGGHGLDGFACLKNDGWDKINEKAVLFKQRIGKERAESLENALLVTMDVEEYRSELLARESIKENVSGDNIPMAEQSPNEVYLSQLESMGVEFVSYTGTTSVFNISPNSDFMQQPQMRQMHQLFQVAGVYAKHISFKPLVVDLKSFGNFPTSKSIPAAFAQGGFVPPTPGEWDVSGSIPGIDKITLTADNTGIILGAAMGSGLVTFKLTASGGYLVSATIPFGPKFFSTLAATSAVAAGVFAVAYSVTFGIQKYREHICRKLNRDLIATQQSVETIQMIMTDLSKDLGAEVLASQLGDLIKKTRKARYTVDREIIEVGNRYNRADGRWFGGKKSAKQQQAVGSSLHKQKEALVNLEAQLVFENVKTQTIEQYKESTPVELTGLVKEFDGKILTQTDKAKAAGVKVIVEQKGVELLINNKPGELLAFISELDKIESAEESVFLPKFNYHKRSSGADTNARNTREKQSGRIAGFDKRINAVNTDQKEDGNIPQATIEELLRYAKETARLWHEEAHKDYCYGTPYEKRQTTKLADSADAYIRDFILPLKQHFSKHKSPIDMADIKRMTNFFNKHNDKPIDFFISIAGAMKKNDQGAYNHSDVLIRLVLPSRLTREMYENESYDKQVIKLNIFKKAIPEEADHVEDLRAGLQALERMHNGLKDGADKFGDRADIFLNEAESRYAKLAENRSDGDRLFLHKGREDFMFYMRRLILNSNNILACEKLVILRGQDSDQSGHYDQLIGVIAHATQDSWGGPSILRFLGGRRAYDGLDNKDVAHDEHESLIETPRGYADQEAWLKARDTAIAKMDKITKQYQEKPEDIDVNEMEVQGMIAVTATGQLSLRLNDLMARGYHLDARNLLEEISFGNITSKEDQKLRDQLTFAFRTQAIGHVSSIVIRMLRNELIGSDMGLMRKTLISALDVVGTVERVLPNAIAMGMQSGYEFCQANPEMCSAQAGSTDALMKLGENLTNPRTIPGAMVCAQVALEVIGTLPTETLPRLVGVHQATRQSIQAVQANVTYYGGMALTVGHAANAISYICELGVHSPLSPNFMCSLLSTFMNIWYGWNERTLDQWGLLPEQGDYYASKSFKETALSSVGATASLYLLASGGLALPLVALGLSALSIARSCYNGTQDMSCQQALSAALRNIQTMEQLRWHITYLEKTPILLLTTKPAQDNCDKVKKGQVIILSKVPNAYILYTQSADRKLKETCLDISDTTVNTIFDDKDKHPRFATETGKVIFARIIKRALITHPIFNNYLKKVKYVLTTAPLTTKQQGQVLAGIHVIFERFGEKNNFHYRLHFAIKRDLVCSIAQSVTIEEEELLDELDWKKITDELTDDLIMDLRTLAATMIVGYYTERSRASVSTLLEQQFGGDEAYNANQDRLFNEARKMLLMHQIQQQMIKAINDKEVDVPVPAVKKSKRKQSDWITGVLKLTTIDKEKHIINKDYKIPLRFGLDPLRARLVVLARQQAQKIYSFDSHKKKAENKFKRELKSHRQYLYDETAASYQQEWEYAQDLLKEAVGVYSQELISLASLSLTSLQRYKDNEAHVTACREHILFCLEELSTDFKVCTWKDVLSVESAFYVSVYLYAIDQKEKASVFLNHVKSHLKAFLDDKDESTYLSYLNLMMAHFGSDEIIDIVFSENGDRHLQLLALNVAAHSGKWDKVERLKEKMKLEKLPPYAYAKKLFDQDVTQYLSALDALKEDQHRDCGYYWQLVLDILEQLANSLITTFDKASMVEMTHWVAAARKFSFDQWVRFDKLDLKKDNELVKIKNMIEDYFVETSNQYFNSKHNELTEKQLVEMREQLLQSIADMETGHAANKLLSILINKIKQEALLFEDDDVAYLPYIYPQAIGSFYGIFGLNTNEVIDMLIQSIQPTASKFNLLSNHVQRTDILNHIALVIRPNMKLLEIFQTSLSGTLSDLELVTQYLNAQRKSVFPTPVMIEAIAYLMEVNIQYVNRVNNTAQLQLGRLIESDNSYSTIYVWQDQHMCHKLMPMQRADIVEVSEQVVAKIKRQNQSKHAASRGLLFTQPKLSYCQRVYRQCGLQKHDATQAPGNCLFDNIAKQLDIDSAQLRQDLVLYMRTHKEDFAALLTVPGTLLQTHKNDVLEVIYTDWESYCDIMSEDLVWATEFEISALAFRLDLPIVVFSDIRENILIYNEEADADPLILEHCGDNHFVSIVPRATASISDAYEHIKAEAHPQEERNAAVV